MENLDSLLRDELSDFGIQQIASKRIAQLDFSSIAQEFAQIQEVLLRVQLSERYLSSSEARLLGSAVEELRSIYIQILTLAPSDKINLRYRYDSLLSELLKLKEQIFKASAQAIALNAPTNTAIYQDQLENFYKRSEDLNFLLNSLRSDTQALVTSKTATYYNDLAGIYDKKTDRANLALLGAIVIMICIFILLLIFYHPPIEKHDLYFKGIIFSNIIALGWFTLRLLLKNLRSMQHLSVVNLSKARNLQAGEIYIATSKTDKEREDVNRAIIESVFSIDESGFSIARERVSSSVPNVWVNLSKLLGGKSVE